MSGDHRYLAVTILLMIERYCRLIVSQVPLIAAKLVGLAQDRLMQIRLKCSRSADLVSLGGQMTEHSTVYFQNVLICPPRRKESTEYHA